MSETSVEPLVAERLAALEQSVVGKLDRIHEELDRASGALSFLEDALHTYTERHLSRHTRVFASVLSRAMNDSELRWPHRKLLDALLKQPDFRSLGFHEIHFSLLVKQARVGKQAAKRYLLSLEARGYVERRTDGYRIFYRLREQQK